MPRVKTRIAIVIERRYKKLLERMKTNRLGRRKKEAARLKQEKK